MSIIINNELFEKANSYKKPLRVKEVRPVKIVEFKENENCFQNIEVVEKGDFSLPVELNRWDKILVDFGEHFVGYLNFSLENHGLRICDSPVRLRFSFGEFPYEILKPYEEYSGDLGNGWFQREERFLAWMPCSTRLDRRYAFRYLLIERIDNGQFSVLLRDLFAETVSAVDVKDALPIDIKDETLKRIYDASLRTLKECEQDVFEDGPKRDRRLWLGDLRVQAITDYKTFKNYDLVKRCLYLLGAIRTDSKKVSSCFFPDSPPYIDDLPSWIFDDYCLFFISCLYDYYMDSKDMEPIRDLYEIAKEQVLYVKDTYKTCPHPFIDWCPDLDKEVAYLGVYVYTLKQFKFITALMEYDTKWIEEEIYGISKLLLSRYDAEKGLFVTSGGQISQHSQVWGILGGVLNEAENIALAQKIESLDTKFTMRTPFAVHYYLEALYSCGLKDKTIAKIKDYWGKILDAGFDCCPECFNEENDFESPYNAPEINSACHAWSCTPAYWIYKTLKEEK